MTVVPGPVDASKTKAEGDGLSKYVLLTMFQFKSHIFFVTMTKKKLERKLVKKPSSK